MADTGAGFRDQTELPPLDLPILEGIVPSTKLQSEAGGAGGGKHLPADPSLNASHFESSCGALNWDFWRGPG
jgi:hypothetical protein